MPDVSLLEIYTGYAAIACKTLSQDAHIKYIKDYAKVTFDIDLTDAEAVRIASAYADENDY